MIFMSIISVVIFLLLCYLLIKSAGFSPIVVSALIIKILAGVGLGLLYKYHYRGGDTFQYFKEAATFANFFMDHPADVFNIYFHTAKISDLSDLIIYSDEPRALFFSKIVSIFYLLTGGNYWILSAFFSLICFLGIYLFVTEVNRHFSIKKRAPYIAFYFLPSFVFWTSGLLKESIAMFALTIAVTITLKFIRTKDYLQFTHWIYLIVSLWLLWQLKYYYAAIAIPLLSSLLIYYLFEKNKKLRAVIVSLALILGVFLISNLHYNLNFSRIPAIIYENYQRVANSDVEGTIRYNKFDGSIYGYLVNIPIALFSGLFRPMVGETSNLLQLIVALENLAILIVLVIAFVRARFRVSLKDPYVIITMGYVFSLATLLAFAMPNFGTLSRYKIGYWPFFVLLVILLFIQNKKGQNLHDPGLKKSV